MKTKTENLRELDNWIAVNIFRWQEFREEEYPHRMLWREGEAGSRVWGEPHRYTEGTHFQELLEKCAEKAEDCVCVWHGIGGFVVGTFDRTTEVSEATLPLAICKIAKALYSR